MGLADAMPEKTIAPLRVDELIEELDTADAATFHGWLLDPSVSAGRISDAMTGNGTPISENPIRLWRRRHVIV